MTSFEFLSVLISVVVGLGIAHLLTGIGRLINRAETTRFFGAHMLWTAFVFCYMVIYWWTIVFGYQDWQNWNIVIFLFVLAYGVLLFLLAVVLYPTDLPETWDTRTHFINMRRWFSGIFLLLVLTELTDTGLKSHFDEFSIPYFFLIGSWIVCAVVTWVSTNHRAQNFVSGCALASQLLWTVYQLRDLEWVMGT